MARELAELGADPDQVAAWEDQADAVLEDEDEPPFELWPENVEPVQVLTLCQWQMVSVGMAGARYAGIETAEALAVMDVLQIPPERRESVLAALRYMVSIALPLLNKEH